MIIRQQQLDRLVSSMGNGAVKIVTGIRRCGKSYLLNTIFRRYLKKQVARETLPLLRTGDVFHRMIVSDGNTRFWTDESGVSHVGIIPFLLDSTILDAVVHR